MRKRIASILLACLSCGTLALGACGDGGKEQSAGLSDVTLWGMPGTEKVYQDIDKNSGHYAYYKQEAKVDLTMAKGEFEGDHIIISADKDAEYNVISGALKCGESEIPVENVEVFAQKYLTVAANHDMSSNMPIARYPDALIPMANLKAAGENVVKKGENQGIYVRVRTAIDQTPGVYTGNLTVKIGKESTSVPVSVNVVDVEVSEVVHNKSVFLNGWYWYEGELDTTGEMWDAYNDALLDYRLGMGSQLNYCQHHMEDISTPEKLSAWIEEAYDYMQDPRCSTINMPYQHIANADLNMTKMREVLSAIFNYSVEHEYNMFAKLVWYGGMIDEPRGNGIMEKARRVSKQFNDTKLAFAEEIENNENITTPLKAEMVQSIIDIPNIVTEYYDEALDDFGATFCPLFQYYDAESLRDDYKDQKEKWWYGCVQPRAPYPTYHIDDTWLSARLIGWMQAEYDVVGNLFWANDLYATGSTAGGYQSIEEYYEGTAARFPNVNGDGFLFYPGKKYGVNGPLGSMRLEAIRDGYEEYEILYAIKQRYEAAGASLNGYSLDFEGFVNSLTSSMYSGTVVSTSTEEFSAARENLFKAAQLNQTTDFAVIDYSDDGYGNKTYSFIIDKDWTVKEGDSQLTAIAMQGEYSVYTIQKKMDNERNDLQFVFTNGEMVQTYNVDMGGKVSVVYGKDLNVEDFEEKTVFPSTEAIGTSLKITLAQITDPDIVDQAFYMQGSNLANVNVNTGKIVLHVYYAGNDGAVLTLNGKFANSRVQSELKTFALQKGENEIVIDLGTKNMQISGILERIAFAFYREKDATGIPAHAITIRDIVFYEK